MVSTLGAARHHAEVCIAVRALCRPAPGVAGLRAAADPDEKVCAAAAGTLNGHSRTDPRAADVLAGLFWDLSPWVQICALESLGHAQRLVRSSCQQPQTVLVTRAIMLAAGMAGRGGGMAGVWVAVCLPAEAADDIQGALARAVAPFYSDTDDNPVERGMWDERRIQGGSDGLGFAVAPGYWDDPRLIHDDPGRDGAPRPSAPGVCAGGPRALLDFSQPHLASERAAAASWDLWHSLLALHPPAVPLATFVARWRNDPQAFPGDRWGDEMLAAYRAQPLIAAYLDHPFSLDMDFLGFVGPADPVEHPIIGYEGTREEYIRRFTSPDPRNTDVLTVDGWWLEGGSHAVHASCHPDLCPHDPPVPTVWPGSEAYLADLPGDTILIRLRCHA